MSVPEVELESELQSCQDYLGKVDSILPLLLRIGNATAQSGLSDTARSILKQPTAPLPKFTSADNDDLIKFFIEFEGTTGAYNYPDRDLLLLLKQQVEGRAKVLLDSLEADKQKYADAKNLLLAAFASEEMRKQSTIKQLTQLKLTQSDDPFVSISKLRTLQ